VTVSQTSTDVVEELRWRGLVAISTDEDALASALRSGPVPFYVGFDPTAPSLHLGHLLQLVTARRLQLGGHPPILLVGGATGLVGDPRPTAERTLNDPSVVAEWVEKIRRQVSPFVDLDGPAAGRVVNNLDWTAPLSAIEFLRDVGKHFRVNRMLAKEAVSARLESDAGISYTEFSYQILQSLDYLELYRRHGCRLQLGGSDQWGNITAGVDLIHRVEGASVHALSTPLITRADGTKFSKTDGGALWLDPTMTSPYAFYQFWLNAEDAKVGEYLRFLTFRSREEIEELERATAERPQAREAQRALAADVTDLVHGEEARQRVEEASRALFGRGDLQTLDAAVLADAVAELPTARVPPGPHLVVDLFTLSGLVASKSAARRVVAEGGAYVNNRKVDQEDAVLDPADLLAGGWAVLRRGKRSLAAVAFTVDALRSARDDEHGDSR
jgi:tyrosyl-tRNA synthetase